MTTWLRVVRLLSPLEACWSGLPVAVGWVTLLKRPDSHESLCECMGIGGKELTSIIAMASRYRSSFHDLYLELQEVEAWVPEAYRSANILFLYYCSDYMKVVSANKNFRGNTVLYDKLFIQQGTMEPLTMKQSVLMSMFCSFSI